MTLTITLERHGVSLNTNQEQRVRRQLTTLGRRLVHRPEPAAVLSFSGPNGQREIEASLRVQLGPLGPTLTSSQTAQTPDRAAHLAIQAIERQLERLVAGQRGESSYGVPSRRRLETHRGHANDARGDLPPASDGL
jgi:ribosome-associated translation inhibitor RaiA